MSCQYLEFARQGIYNNNPRLPKTVNGRYLMTIFSAAIPLSFACVLVAQLLSPCASSQRLRARNPRCPFLPSYSVGGTLAFGATRAKLLGEILCDYAHHRPRPHLRHRRATAALPAAAAVAFPATAVAAAAAAVTT